MAKLMFNRIKIIPTPGVMRKSYGYNRLTITCSEGISMLMLSHARVNTLTRAYKQIRAWRVQDKIYPHVIVEYETLDGLILLDTDDDWVMAILQDSDSNE